MEIIDLHVHSIASDGTLSPREIAIHAKENGLLAIALTDHDTISGVQECICAGKEIGLQVIPGIELAAQYLDHEIHILGYNIDITSGVLNNKLKFLIQSRMQRNNIMLERLNALGLYITYDDLFADSDSQTVVTRSHFARALTRNGYTKNNNEAFEKYLTPGKPAYVKRMRFTPSECISLIHEAGGIASLAHPTLYTMNHTEMKNMIKELSKLGLDAIESYYSTYTQAQTTAFVQLCKNLNLIPTGGSDFHGENKPKLKIGVGYGNTVVPAHLLHAINKRTCLYKK